MGVCADKDKDSYLSSAFCYAEWHLTWTKDLLSCSSGIVLHARDFGKNKTHKLFQREMQNFTSSLINLKSDVDASFGGLRKTCGKTSGSAGTEEPVSKQVPAEGHRWLLLNILPFKYSLPKRWIFHSRLVLWRCYILAQGIILAVLFSISIIYFNYQVLEQENLIQFTYREAICNVDEVDEYKMQRRLQHFKKSVLMVQLEGFLRILLHSRCSTPALAPVYWAAWCHYMESCFVKREVVL